jgi:hypothetical protein
MDHLNPDLTLAHQAMRREEAAAYRRSAAVRSERPKRSLSAVLARARRAEGRVPAPLSA